MKLLELLQLADLNLLYVLNVKLENGYMDQFWLFITQMHKNKIVMWGLIPALIGWMFYVLKAKAIRPLLAMAMAVAIADSVSYRGIKSVVHRPRPFQNADTGLWLRKIGQAHGPSFPSNHAANCFAGAFVLAWYFRRRAVQFYTFALLVSVSRVSLGLHYPTDIIAGAAIGIFVGWALMKYGLGRTKWFAVPVRKKERASRRFEYSDWNWRKKSRRLQRD